MSTASLKNRESHNVRVVVDTNIFISSFFGGYPGRIVDLWKTGRITLCLSNAIIEEYIDVLQRMGIADTQEFGELMLLFRSQFNCVFTNRTPSLSVCVDPDDNKFIEAAVALKAEYIISGDSHLKSLKKYFGILIIPPRDFIEYADKDK
jgi:putative PIN family toxin of toxin-antitoxin system